MNEGRFSAGRIEQVRRGQPVMTWSYTREEWRQHLARTHRRTVHNSLPWVVAIVVIGAALSISWLVAGWETGAAALGVVIIAQLVSFRWRLKRLHSQAKAGVEITSTGLFFAGHGHLWQALEAVDLQPGMPPYLHVDFSTDGRDVHVEIPIPSGSARDLTDLVTMLNERIDSRSKGQSRSS